MQKVTDITIDTKSKISNVLAYGLGETLTNLVNDKSNVNLKINVDGKKQKKKRK